MDSSYAHPQSMGQSPFFYYNPDPKPDNRQHGHFSQQPSNIQVPVYHPHMQPMPSTPIYSRPNSACSQPPMHPQMYNNGYPMSMTPMASPRPMYQNQKPTIMIQEHAPRMMMESDMHENDMYYYPSTPPLSASGSTISSPSSCDVLPTPMNTIFFGMDSFEGVKDGCQGEVQAENLAGGEWARCGSPPMTPGTCKCLIAYLEECMIWPCRCDAVLELPISVHYCGGISVLVNYGLVYGAVADSTFLFCSVHPAQLAYEQRQR